MSTPAPCPFCGEEMKWRSSDEQFIHPGQSGCIMIGIGLNSHRLVYLWNTREGAPPTADDIFGAVGRLHKPAATPAPGNPPPGTPGRQGVSAASKPPPPPPPPPRAPASEPPGAKWVALKFTVNGGGQTFAFRGLVDVNDTKGIYNERY